MARRRRGIALVEHIAARDKLAMQVLFARHRTIRLRCWRRALPYEASPANAQEPDHVRTVGALMGFANDADDESMS
jgi:hypothetical protein